MNPNTPIQPDDHEVRTCRIGPMSESDYALQPEQLRQAVQQVAAGEMHENNEGVEVIAGSTSETIKCVQQEVLLHARRFLLNKGLPLEQVSRSLDRLYEGNGQELPKRTAQNVESIRQETVKQIVFGLELSLEEMLVNHAKHGNRDPRKTIGVRYWIDGEGKMHVVSWDEGQGFDPAIVPDPRSPEALEKANGRGRILTASFSNDFEDGSEGPTGRFGTSVHFSKQLTGLDACPEDPQEPKGFSVLDKYIARAAQKVATDNRTKDEDTARQHEELERERRLSRSWFGLRRRLYDLLGNV